MSTKIFWHPDIALHDQHNHHLAMVPDRLPTIQASLASLGLEPGIRFEESTPATDESILAVHSKEHLQFLRDNCPEVNIFVIDMDTVMTPYTLKTIYLSSGGGINRG